MQLRELTDASLRSLIGTPMVLVILRDFLRIVLVAVSTLSSCLSLVLDRPGVDLLLLSSNQRSRWLSCKWKMLWCRISQNEPQEHCSTLRQAFFSLANQRGAGQNGRQLIWLRNFIALFTSNPTRKIPRNPTHCRKCFLQVDALVPAVKTFVHSFHQCKHHGNSGIPRRCLRLSLRVVGIVAITTSI
jgi:hypothetical protein